MDKFKLLVIILLVCTGVFILSACVRTRDPESAVKIFIEAAEEMDTEAAFRCIMPDLRRRYRATLKTAAELAGTPQEKLLPVLARIPYLTTDKGVPYEVLDISMIDDTHAAVHIRVQINKDLSKEVSIPCIKHRRNWYIGE